MAHEICFSSYSTSLSRTSHLRPRRIAAHYSPGVLGAFHSSVPREDGGGRGTCPPSASIWEVHEERSPRRNVFYKEQQMAIRKGLRLEEPLLNFSHKIFPLNGHLKHNRTLV